VSLSSDRNRIKHATAKQPRVNQTASADDALPTLLIVDAGATLAESLQNRVEPSGYRVVQAKSGEEGLRLAAETLPVAIVVDGEMHGMDDWTFISRIKSDLVLRDIPCVFLSGSDPVRTGIVASLNRPGGNITGLTWFASDLVPKRLGLLHELAPKAIRVAVLVNPNTVNAEATVSRIEPDRTGRPRHGTANPGLARQHQRRDRCGVFSDCA
jgi:CheY-like chemotaxis protein